MFKHTSVVQTPHTEIFIKIKVVYINVRLAHTRIHTILTMLFAFFSPSVSDMPATFRGFAIKITKIGRDQNGGSNLVTMCDEPPSLNMADNRPKLTSLY